MKNQKKDEIIKGLFQMYAQSYYRTPKSLISFMLGITKNYNCKFLFIDMERYPQFTR